MVRNFCRLFVVAFLPSSLRGYVPRLLNIGRPEKLAGPPLFSPPRPAIGRFHTPCGTGQWPVYASDMTYLWLGLAIVCEAGWALAMKASDGLTKVGWTAATVVLYIVSLVFLAFATRKMDIGTGYAIWAGTGVALIALGGIFLFNEQMTLAKGVSLGLIVLGIVGLNLATGGH